MASFRELVSDMGRQLGMDNLAPDEHGVCEIVSEEADIVVMDCTEAGGNVLVAAKVADAPQDEIAACKAALEANKSLSGGSGATVSMDADDGSFFIALYRPLDSLDGNKMVALMERFASELLSVREVLAKSAPERR
ncbi:MAG: type III secretion system chaperone [Kiritimatiellae bacterium]|nr:type III secretion system chaperone [Kiritimatiellia bacterium]